MLVFSSLFQSFLLYIVFLNDFDKLIHDSTCQPNPTQKWSDKSWVGLVFPIQLMKSLGPAWIGAIQQIKQAQVQLQNLPPLWAFSFPNLTSNIIKIFSMLLVDDITS